MLGGRQGWWRTAAALLWYKISIIINRSSSLRPRPPSCQAVEAWPHPPSNSPQTHLSRSGLNPDMAADAQRVVGQATRLLQSMVDVISSSGWLNPALAGALALGRGCRGAVEL